jgi:hypothetical protein
MKWWLQSWLTPEIRRGMKPQKDLADFLLQFSLGVCLSMCYHLRVVTRIQDAFSIAGYMGTFASFGVRTLQTLLEV